MENPFKKILHNEQVPEILKNRVMNDISLIKLSIDLADLMVVKYPETITNLLDFENENQKTTKKKK
jgi:hypothetical protein